MTPIPDDPKIGDLIAEMLANSEEPPTADYCLYEHVESVAQGLSQPECLKLAVAALRELPACMAETVVNAVLGVRPIPNGDLVLLEWIDRGMQLESAAVTVSILVTHYGWIPDDLVDDLLHRVSCIAEGSRQDRLAFALWVLFNGETTLVREDKTVGFFVSPRDGELRTLLGTSQLSAYARSTLAQCISQDA